MFATATRRNGSSPNAIRHPKRPKVHKALEATLPSFRQLARFRHWPEYAYTKTHYLNVDEGETIESMPKNPKGDVLSAVTEITEKLKSGKLTPDEETRTSKC